MTLGIARADNRGLHVAIESAAIKKGPPRIILHAPTEMGNTTGKLLDLQSIPRVLLLAGGSLDHWKKFMTSWRQGRPTLALKQVADEIEVFLRDNATKDDEVFGRVCGYEGLVAVCYAIDRKQGDTEASVQRILLEETTSVVGAYAEEAVQRVKQKLTVLSAPDAIQAVLNELVTYDKTRANDDRELLAPVHSMSIVP
jgi:hypothetical protein